VNKILIIVAVIILIATFTAIAMHGIKLHEINECVKWQEESKIYPNYYFEGWQLEQCENYDIPLL
jgi:flagellar basal body-associated protein FliL